MLQTILAGGFDVNVLRTRSWSMLRSNPILSTTGSTPITRAWSDVAGVQSLTIFFRIALTITALIPVLLLKDASVVCMYAVVPEGVFPGVLSVEQAFAKPKTLQAVCSLLSVDRQFSCLFKPGFSCKTHTTDEDDGCILTAKENMVQWRRIIVHIVDWYSLP